MLPTYPLTVGVVIGSGGLLEEAMSTLAGLPVRIAFDQRQISDWSEFIEKLNRTLLDVVIVELNQLHDPLHDVVRQIKSTSSNPYVIVVHETADPETILKVIRAEANEYLYPPIHDDLQRALQRMSADRASRRSGTRPRGKIIGLVSAKGGCGTTTLACHLAAELKRITGLDVLLADFDMETGIVGFLMKAQSRYSVEDALTNAHRMDLSFWKALVADGHAGVEVIVAPPQPLPSAEHHPYELRDILRFVRSNYDWVVVDFGRYGGEHYRTVFEELDHLLLVATPEIPALHRAKEVRRHLVNGSSDSEERNKLVLNKLPRRREITLDEMGRMIGASVYATVASDEGTLHDAYAEGGLAGAKTRIGQEITRLASRIAGVQEKKSSKFKITFSSL